MQCKLTVCCSVRLGVLVCVGEMSLRRIYAWTGDFGIDLVVLFKFNPADVSRIPEARIAVFLATRLPRCLSQSSDYAGRRRRRNIASSVF